MPADQDASKCYGPADDEYYYGCGYTIVSTGREISAVAEFTESEQTPEETVSASRVTRTVLAKPIWMVGDSAYDTVNWPTPAASKVVVPVAPYNAGNTDNLEDVEYTLEDRIEQHNEDVRSKQSALDETYNRRTEIERTNGAVNDCGLGRPFARDRAHARTHVFLALCIRLVVAINTYERGDKLRGTVITVS